MESLTSEYLYLRGEQMRETINVFVDMDGVQTIYDKADSVEEMMKPGYFSSRTPHEHVIEFLKELIRNEEFSVTVLSAVFTDNHSVMEKCIWLEEQGIGSVDKMFVPCGVPKAEFIKDEDINILIDDFSKNLFEWEAAGSNFYGIKFMNEVNGENGSWKNINGPILDYRMSADELMESFIGYVNLFTERNVA